MIIKKKLSKVTSIMMSLLMIAGILGTGPQKVMADDTQTNNVISNFDFESNDTQGWGPRGGETVAVSSEAFHSGSKSLKTTNRTSFWNGPSVNMTGKMENGKTYHVIVWAMYNGDNSPSTQGLEVDVQRDTTDANNTLKSNYESVTGASKTLTKGVWTKLEGNYTVPSPTDTNNTGFYLYIQAPWKSTQTSADLIDFYIDDVNVSETIIKPVVIQNDIPSLHEVYDKYFPIGTAVVRPVLDNSTQVQLIKKHYDSITPGNEMKWDAVEPTEGNFNFTNADAIANFATSNGMKLRGHTLLWHSQVPSWVFKGPDGTTGVATRDLLLQRLKNHIQTEVTHYKGKIYTWDVANEVLSDRHSGLRGSDENSLWTSIIGDVDGDGYDSDFIELAFKYAHEADPNALLAINDYGLESSTDKAESMYQLVKRLKAKGVPIDAIGMQMHISIYGPSVDQVKATIEKFASLGVKVQITEMDMSIYSSSSEAEKTPTEDILETQAQRYKELFDVFKEESTKGNLISVTLWGSADNDSWLDGFPVQGRLDAPLLFDRQLQAKLAYWALVDPSKLPVPRQTVQAPNATPTLGNTVDDIWGVAKSFTANQYVLGSSGSTAAIKTLWDDKNLYILANVNDSTPGANDSIEIFLDKNFDKSTTYGTDDKHYTINRDNSGSTDITHYTQDVDGGYVVQVAIPISDITPAINKTVGFDVRVNDDKGDGSISSKAVWNDYKNKLDSDTSGFGNLLLAGVTKITDVIQGTPDIDGTIDDAWKNAKVINTDTAVQGSTGSTAKVRTMWDKDYIYVLAEVTDNNLSKSSSNPWEQDSVETFIDQNNSKSTSYEGDDGQYRVNYDNETSFGGNCDKTNFKSATKVTDTGYILEEAIPLNSDNKGYVGKLLGFDAQVNNDDGSGKRTSIFTWNDVSGADWSNPSCFGVLRLLDTVPPVINVTGITDGADIILNSDVTVNWTASDSGSGLATAAAGSQKLDTKTVGKHSISITATDKAGNTAVKQINYNVIYNFSGVLSPLCKDSVKTYKYGRDIPVQFSLTDANGKNISSAAATISIFKLNDKGETVGSSTITPASSGKANNGSKFRYDISSSQYIFNLSTKNSKMTEGKYRISISLDDGKTYDAYINIEK